MIRSIKPSWLLAGVGRVYTALASAKSGAGFGDPLRYKAHKRPKKLGAFFVPGCFVMAVCLGRSSGLPVTLYAGSPTLYALPPLLGDTGGSTYFSTRSLCHD